jgi:hypothetical protein
MVPIPERRTHVDSENYATSKGDEPLVAFEKIRETAVRFELGRFAVFGSLVSPFRDISRPVPAPS